MSDPKTVTREEFERLETMFRESLAQQCHDLAGKAIEADKRLLRQAEEIGQIRNELAELSRWSQEAGQWNETVRSSFQEHANRLEVLDTRTAGLEEGRRVSFHELTTHVDRIATESTRANAETRDRIHRLEQRLEEFREAITRRR